MLSLLQSVDQDCPVVEKLLIDSYWIGLETDGVLV